MAKITDDPLATALAQGEEELNRLCANPEFAEAMGRDVSKIVSLDRERIIDRIVRTTGVSRQKAAAEYEEGLREATAYPAPLSSAALKNNVYPPIQWVFDKLIREGIPQTLDGDGGIGKSNVVVGVTVAVGAGVEIFGKATLQRPCLFVTHEDDEDDLQAMAKAYADALKVDLETLPVEWWSLLEHDITLADIDDKGKWTPGPFMVRFEAKLRSSPRGLFVVLDCRSDVVQMNEVLREPPNTFYKTVLTPLCKRYGCTILVLCHPSKASMSDGSYYSGGTGNKSALRNKLVMKLEDTEPNADPNGPRLFGVLKRNRGERDKSLLRLTFDPEREIYVADGDKTAAGEPPVDKYAAVVNIIKQLVERGVVVQQGYGGGQSPKDIADALAADKITITAKEVRKIMNAALRNGALGYRYRKPGERLPAGFELIAQEPSLSAEPPEAITGGDEDFA